MTGRAACGCYIAVSSSKCFIEVSKTSCEASDMVGRCKTMQRCRRPIVLTPEGCLEHYVSLKYPAGATDANKSLQTGNENIQP